MIREQVFLAHDHFSKQGLKAFLQVNFPIIQIFKGGKNEKRKKITVCGLTSRTMKKDVFLASKTYVLKINFVSDS